MDIRTLARNSIAAAAVLALAVTTAGSARADDLVADSTSHGPIIAAGGGGSAIPRSGPVAVASLPRGIVVTRHDGKPVALFAAGQPPLRKSRPGSAPATFTGLTAGTSYTVIVGGSAIGRVVAVDRPQAATRLVVRATTPTGNVNVNWNYRDLKSTGGANVTFLLRATSPTAPTVATRVARMRSATLSGLAPTALYTFSVTPINSAGGGRATTARMTKTLAEISSASVPTAPAPTLTPTPTPTPAPAAPATRTIYVCATDYVENSSGTCTRTLPFTYHQVATGPAPILVSYETIARACPAGYNLEDYGWVMYCRLYGPIPTIAVKDPTPAGFTDNGNAWVRTVPKDAVVVPA